MKKISKGACEYLISKGLKFKEDELTHTRCRKRNNYYLCENKYNLKLLKEYEKSIGIGD